MKATSFLSAFGVLFAAFFFTGCGTVIAPSTTSSSSQTDVYVAGIVYDPAGRSIGTYWKNGVATSVGDNVYGSYATGIVVSGSDVYVAGAVGGSNLQGHDIATYWKNGNPYPLTDGTQEGYSNALAVSGNDVYVAGGYFGGWDSSGNQLPGFAGYWKNSSPVDFSNGSWGIEIRSIFVSGSDVYVAGAVDVTTQVGPNSYYETPVATVWKNSVPTQLTDPLHFSRAFSVFVSGTDVYVAGEAAQTAQQLDYTATYWKNGVPITVPASAGSSYSSLTGIFVYGSDVYVAGGDSLNGAEYWKNGTLVPLLGSYTGQMVVSSGGHTYVAGTNYPTYAIGPGIIDGVARGHATSYNYIGATYWKDGYGVPLAPSAYTSVATAITVVGP
jgi:hypothetical protein